MIVYDVHTAFCMSPLVKGRLVVVAPTSSPGFLDLKTRKDQNPFRSLLSYRARNEGLNGVVAFTVIG